MMKIKIIGLFFLTLGVINQACFSGDVGAGTKLSASHEEVPPASVRPAADQPEVWLPLVEGRHIALVVNQTSRVGERHLVDFLMEKGVFVRCIFAPEHGFRGTADAGQTIENGKDTQTGLPITSLYGKHKKPTREDLTGVEMVVFDIQDVGARFYTYISTMTYVMEACAEQGIPFVVLDRPNPNGHYVDGPVLEPAFRSFVGMHPVPVVHGMTVGEYARMVNGEGWLSEGKKCDLTVVPCENYAHADRYDLPVAPSPNLPNARAVALYPSLCFFEGTVVSVGRGTDRQFQVIGAPDSGMGDFEFTPESRPGARHPKHEGRRCRGFDLSGLPVDSIRAEGRLNLGYLLDFYRHYPDPAHFFLPNHFFDKLAGTASLRRQIESGATEAEIRKSWAPGLAAFRETRARYLLYD